MKTLTMPVTSHKVRDAFRHAKQLRSEYLDARDWRLDDNFPDRRPRWCKTINGRQLTLSAGGAFAMERGLE